MGTEIFRKNRFSLKVKGKGNKWFSKNLLDCELPRFYFQADAVKGGKRELKSGVDTSSLILTFYWKGKAKAFFSWLYSRERDVANCKKDISIYFLDNQLHPVHKFNFFNCYIQDADFGTLDYSSPDKPIKVRVTLSFDKFKL